MLAIDIAAPEILLAAVVFVTVLAVWGIAILLRQRVRGERDRRIAQRLGAEGRNPDEAPTRVLRLWHDGREETTVVPKAIDWLSPTARLSRLCQEAGWDISIWTLLLGAFGVAAMILLGSLVVARTALPGVGLVIAAAVAFWIYLKQRINRRTALFERQLVDALQIAVRSLRAGHPLGGAFQIVASEIPDPVGQAFSEICQQQAFGMSLEEAIQRVATRSGSADMRLFATSVVIHVRSGGNLADMIDRLAFLIRERMRLNRRVRVLLAQVQLSKNILLALPFVLVILIAFAKPGYMQPLYTTNLGKQLMIAGFVLIILGIYTMNRLARLKY